MIYVVYFSDAGAPKTGLSPSLITYKKVSDNSDVGSPPGVSEIGGGFYKFSATPTQALVATVDGGGSLAAADRYKVMQITPHDGDLDAQVSSRAPEAAGNLAAVKAKTDNLPADPAVESNLEAHVLAVLNAYDPPTRAEATADKDAVLAAVAALHDTTVGEILSGDLTDSLSFPANSLADLIRKLFWMVCNRMVITDGSGAVTAYKTDGVTPAATGTITDNGAITERSEPTWP
jgi:hypothetical protein